MKKIGLLALILWSCNPSPKPIEYGADACHFCKMNIVDNKYATEAVTTKGKVFVFDAIECELRFLKQQKETEFAYLLVNTYDNPGEWTDAKSAYFLISPALPSPMGANLTAFESEGFAKKMQQEKSGELVDWNSLLDRFD